MSISQSLQGKNHAHSHAHSIILSLPLYTYNGESAGSMSPVIGNIAPIISWFSPCHSEHIAIGYKSTHCLSKHVISIVKHCNSISYPRDSRSWTTSRAACQTELRNERIKQLCLIECDIILYERYT